MIVNEIAYQGCVCQNVSLGKITNPAPLCPQSKESNVGTRNELKRKEIPDGRQTILLAQEYGEKGMVLHVGIKSIGGTVWFSNYLEDIPKNGSPIKGGMPRMS